MTVLKATRITAACTTAAYFLLKFVPGLPLWLQLLAVVLWVLVLATWAVAEFVQVFRHAASARSKVTGILAVVVWAVFWAWCAAVAVRVFPRLGVGVHPGAVWVVAGMWFLVTGWGFARFTIWSVEKSAQTWRRFHEDRRVLERR
jgi:hypothetical protein